MPPKTSSISLDFDGGSTVLNKSLSEPTEKRKGNRQVPGGGNDIENVSRSLSADEYLTQGRWQRELTARVRRNFCSCGFLLCFSGLPTERARRQSDCENDEAHKCFFVSSKRTLCTDSSSFAANSRIGSAR
jgi:hypothetical protein